MWVGKFALSDEGLPAGGVAWVDLGTTAASAPAVVNGAAYHPTYSSPDGISALYVTTEAVAAADAYIGGFRYRADGVLRVYDATAAVPAGSNTNQGIALTSDGQLCYTTGNTTSFNLNGVAVDALRRVYAAPLAFELQFADLGAGAVDTAEEVFGTTPTFTRATTAWTRASASSIGWREVASGVPRSYYSTTAYLGYLAEGARTNSALWARDITNAVWVPVDITPAKDQIGIDGVANSASSITATGANGTILQTLVLTATSRTYSVFIKRLSGVGAIELTQDGLAFTAVTVTSEYTQVSLNASVLNPIIGIRIVDSGDSVAVDMNQEEAGAFASTPIPTTTAAVARNADVLTYPTTGWLNAAAGTFMLEARSIIPVGTDHKPLQIDDGTANERIQFPLTSADAAVFIVNDGGVAQASINTGTVTQNVSYKVSGAYEANNFAAVLDGGTVGTDTSGTIPTVTTMRVSDVLNGVPFFGPIRRVAYYAARLANATLQGLTA